ncbi:hypothetical protein [Scytonema sp. HK-05]
MCYAQPQGVNSLSIMGYAIAYGGHSVSSRFPSYDGSSFHKPTYKFFT